MSESFIRPESVSHILPLFIFVFAFFLGSVPFGLMIARLFKLKDFQKGYVKGIGLTHVAAMAGLWPAGFLTFSLDFSKGVLAVLLATPVGVRLLTSLLAGPVDLSSLEVDPITPWLAGLFAVLGHCYSPWVHFKAGKGVTTAAGVIMMLSPSAALIGGISFMMTFYYHRIVSQACIAGLLVAGVSYLVLHPVGIHLWIGAIMIFIVLMRHEANIDALLENREPTFSILF